MSILTDLYNNYMKSYDKSSNRNGRIYSEDLLKRISDDPKSTIPIKIGGIVNGVFVIDSLNAVYPEKDEKLEYDEQKTIADLEYDAKRYNSYYNADATWTSKFIHHNSKRLFGYPLDTISTNDIIERNRADMKYKYLTTPRIDNVYTDEVIYPWDTEIDNREARRHNDENGNDAVSWKEFNESIHCGIWWES